MLDCGERDQGVVGGTAEDLSGGHSGQKLLVPGLWQGEEWFGGAGDISRTLAWMKTGT